MTTDDYNKKLEKQMELVNKPNFLVPIVGGILGKQVIRLFRVGIGSSGKRIGTYSKRYKKLKQKLGIPNFTVNLRLTNQLQMDYMTSITPQKDGGVVVGVKQKGDPTALRKLYTSKGLTPPSKDKAVSNADKVGYLQKRYGKTLFHLTKSERKIFKEAVLNKLERIFNK